MVEVVGVLSSKRLASAAAEVAKAVEARPGWERRGSSGEMEATSGGDGGGVGGHRGKKIRGGERETNLSY